MILYFFYLNSCEFCYYFVTLSVVSLLLLVIFYNKTQILSYLNIYWVFMLCVSKAQKMHILIFMFFYIKIKYCIYAITVFSP